MDELEEMRKLESSKLREQMRKKAEQFKKDQEAAELEVKTCRVNKSRRFLNSIFPFPHQHAKRKEDLIKSLTNKLKATGQHVECRSIELDLKKKILALEKEVGALTEGQKSSASKRRSVSQSPLQKHPSMLINRPSSGSKIVQSPQQEVATPTKSGGTLAPGADATVRKRKLYSLNSDFMDF